jgi:hypothetical protein
MQQVHFVLDPKHSQKNLCNLRFMEKAVYFWVRLATVQKEGPDNASKAGAAEGMDVPYDQEPQGRVRVEKGLVHATAHRICFRSIACAILGHVEQRRLECALCLDNDIINACAAHWAFRHTHHAGNTQCHVRAWKDWHCAVGQASLACSAPAHREMINHFEAAAGEVNGLFFHK